MVRRLRFSGPKTSIICSPMTSLKTSIKTITYLSDTGCLEIQGASLVIYTTNAIESLNSVIRHAIKKRKVFPTDDSVKKVVWLAIQAASQKWTMPLRDWRMAMSRFIIEFGDRLDGHFGEKAFTQNRVQGQIF
ncbi:Mobile element protein [Escherichia coli O157:H7 str. SS52]|nr:Mobile element protein [Escherichia coli O157:H7 str. SS52]